MMLGRDDDVISRAKIGDAEAWGSLYKAHATRLNVWLDAIPTGDAAADHEDIAAAAWLTASRKIDTFHGSADDFARWLFTIARNIARTIRATSARRATYPVDVTVTDPRIWGLVDDTTASVDARHLALQLLHTLSPREAEIVACIDVAGFDILTTADILGISQVAVRVGHHRGIGRLRVLLSESDVAARPARLRALRPNPSSGVSS